MRLPDWFERLSDVIAAHDAMPFAWGKADCFNFAMDAVAAMRGVADPFEAERRRYRTEAGAARALRRLKAADSATLLVRVFEEIPVAMASVGDLMVMPSDNGVAACGICIGHELLMRGEANLCRVPRSRATRAFRV